MWERFTMLTNRPTETDSLVVRETYNVIVFTFDGTVVAFILNQISSSIMNFE